MQSHQRRAISDEWSNQQESGLERTLRHFLALCLCSWGLHLEVYDLKIYEAFSGATYRGLRLNWPMVKLTNWSTDDDPVARRLSR